MLRTGTAGATALMLILGASAYAQQPPAGPQLGHRQQRTAQDRAAFLDARMAALHAGLHLMPEQETAWPAFEEAARDVAATRASFAGLRTEQSQHDPIERAQRSADALAGVSAALKRYGKALGPLYHSLDDGQKRFRIPVAERASALHRFAERRGRW